MQKTQKTYMNNREKHVLNIFESTASASSLFSDILHLTFT